MPMDEAMLASVPSATRPSPNGISSSSFYRSWATRWCRPTPWP